MASFDGKTPEDIKLWHTYVYWAHESANPLTVAQSIGKQPAIADDPNNRVEKSLSNALQSILFASFALEYRMRRVFQEMGVTLSRETTFGPLLKCFWTRLAVKDRMDKKGKCLPPDEWGIYKPDLIHLVKLRNAIAHADYLTILSSFSNISKPDSVARQLYNSVIEAVKLINIGTGYEVRSREVIDAYFEPLKVP